MPAVNMTSQSDQSDCGGQSFVILDFFVCRFDTSNSIFPAPNSFIIYPFCWKSSGLHRVQPKIREFQLPLSTPDNSPETAPSEGCFVLVRNNFTPRVATSSIRLCISKTAWFTQLCRRVNHQEYSNIIKPESPSRHGAGCPAEAPKT